MLRLGGDVIQVIRTARRTLGGWGGWVAWGDWISRAARTRTAPLGTVQCGIVATAQVNAASSSAKKGETLQDTIRCLECYTDIVVLRHPEKGSAAKAAAALQHAPLLNAGDGPGEHPTQALLDFYTIFDEFHGTRSCRARAHSSALGTVDTGRDRRMGDERCDRRGMALCCRPH